MLGPCDEPDERPRPPRPRRRGRRALPRPDPDRHHQLRRRGRPGGAQGRRARRRAARRGRHRVASCYESAPGRTSVVARWGGRRAATALLLHGHLDVVPAAAEDWQVDPFSGEIQDGYVWGRGAVDMKDFDAMLLSRRPRPAARRPGARAARSCSASPPTRRPAATRAPQVLVEQHRRRARGLHRGDRRGRRVQRHRPRPADLPDRGRREGHGLDAAHRPRPRRPRLDDQPRQRGHRARRRGRPDRRATSGRCG